jgi:branched-subunit amino acid aminotransferase/4-amino-4-deoxychorismate lyase
MTLNAAYLWHDGSLVPHDSAERYGSRLEAADSWLVSTGTALALDLHRSRFLAGIESSGYAIEGAEAFWDAAIAMVPRSGDWFPRVELQTGSGSPLLICRVRPAPPLRRNATLVTHNGADPRRRAAVKGPSLAALMRTRAEAHEHGADEAILLSPQGHVIEGTGSALLWWRGDVLCTPVPTLERVDSVTARTVLAVATALGADISWEETRPAELDGLEVWCANALHGLRIVTRWIDGPLTAQQPGRLGEWRARLDSLRKPLPAPAADPNSR